MKRRLILSLFLTASFAALHAQRYLSHQQTGNSVSVKNEAGTIVLVPYNDYIIKVFQQPDSLSAGERQSVSVVAQPTSSFTVDETSDALLLKTRCTTVTLSKADCTLSFADAQGQVRLKERKALDNSGEEKTASFAPMGDVAFYGGGYNGVSANIDGMELSMNNQPQYGWEMGRKGSLNLNIPFIVSTNGYGILFDNQYMGSVIRPSSSEGTTYRSKSPSPFAYYYVGGDGTMASVMSNYTHLTGRQDLPAYWALGYVTSKYGYFSREETEKVVSDIQGIQFPIDGVVLDLYWQVDTTSQMGNLQWFLPRWPEPEKMTAGLLEKGVHTVVISEPYVTSRSDNYTLLKEKCWLADDSVEQMAWLEADPVGMIDITNPDAAAWMWGYYRKAARQGVTGWWLDLGEPEKDDSTTCYRLGSREEVHNEYANRWMEMLYSGTRREFPQFRPVLMTRSGTAGMQRYGVMPWTGDIARSWAGLHAQIPAMLNTGMSGVAYMGSDVGGFASDGNAHPELYLRWVEQAVFGAMLRTHSAVLPEPYHPCYDGVRDDVRSFVNLHYKYLPYTYTLSYENATAGLPPARPLSFYQATASTANVTDEYLYGRDILVAPVVTEGTTRDIIFPAGRWIDMNNLSTVYDGGTTASYTAPLNVLPHFGRLGSFITRYKQDTFTNTRDIDKTSYSVLYLIDKTEQMSPVEGYIFDDNHISPTSLADGAWRITRMRGVQEEMRHVITLTDEGKGYNTMAQVRHFSFVVPQWKMPVKKVSSMQRGMKKAKKMLKAKTPDDFEHTDSDAWFYDEATATLHISATMQSEETKIVIE